MLNERKNLGIFNIRSDPDKSFCRIRIFILDGRIRSIVNTDSQLILRRGGEVFNMLS